MFSSTFFFIALFVYLGLVWGYQPYLRAQVGRLNDRIQSFSQQISVSDQEKITTFYSQLVNVKSLLGRHAEMSALFSWLEGRTSPNVAYNKFSLNIPTLQLGLAGTGKSVSDVTEQMRVFQDTDGVERVTFGNLGAGQGGVWQFDLTIFFEPNFFTERLGVPQGAAAPTSTQPTSTSTEPVQ